MSTEYDEFVNYFNKCMGELSYTGSLFSDIVIESVVCNHGIKIVNFRHIINSAFQDEYDDVINNRNF